MVARGNPENSGLCKDGKVRCKDCINKKNIEEAQEELIIFKNYCDAGPDDDEAQYDDGFDLYHGIWLIRTSKKPKAK